MNPEDRRHLELLGLFHYIVGGITALFSCMPFIHVFMGLAFLSNKFLSESNGAEPPPFIGWLFVILGSTFILLGWSLAICMIISGKKLKQYKNRTFCIVIAGIECMFMPLGTVLGVFTLMTLTKESVIKIFD